MKRKSKVLESLLMYMEKYKKMYKNPIEKMDKPGNLC